jgi:CheY-like chemotaxis protein
MKAILCVDDEPIIVLSLKRELQLMFGKQFVYESAQGAEEALEIIDQLLAEDIQTILVISDWLMPGMKGDEFLRVLRARHPETKGILVTGQADAQAIRSVLEEATAVAVLRKPWNSAELKGLIQGCCTEG